MKLNQLQRLCTSIGVFFGSIMLAMLVLRIPAVAQVFSPQALASSTGIWLWVLFWLIIMLECSIIPGPYIPFLLFFTGTPLAANKLLFWGVCTSAVIIGRIGAYFVGCSFGNKILKWVATDSYAQWQAKLGGPMGKTIYFITVTAPMFPDFVLALVAGSVRMDFWFYLLTNAVCKAVENWLIIYLGIILSNGGNIWFYIYVAVSSISLVTALILKIISRVRKNPLER